MLVHGNGVKTFREASGAHGAVPRTKNHVIHRLDANLFKTTKVPRLFRNTCEIYIMLGTNTDSVSQMLQRMASLGVSPDEFRDALHSPEHMMGLMTKASHANRGPSLPDADEVGFEIDEIRTRWAAETQLPAQKPNPSSRYDLEEENMMVEQQMSQASLTVSKTFIGQEKWFSTTPITQLQKIDLSDMLARQVHKGRYLICRTFLKAVKQVAVRLCVEDPKGDVVLLTIYNLPGLFQANLKVLDAHFPIGTVIAIREPWMKMSGAVAHPNAFIRVDSPSDIAILEPTDPILRNVKWKTTPTIYRHIFKSAEQWNGQGTQHFKDALFVPAALAWSRGLELDPSFHALRLNRAQAYLRLGWFSAALADAIHVLSTPESASLTSRKASYRAASAEYGLGRYRDALARLEALTEDPDIKSLKSRCRQRYRESAMGEYLWTDMFRAGQNPVPRLDVAQFVSPVLEVTEIPSRGGGRGIKAVKDIKTGDLLVVAKPFASVFPNEFAGDEASVIGINFATRKADSASFIAMISRVLARIQGCPHESNLMVHLYSGATFPPPPPTYPPLVSQSQEMTIPLQWENDVDVVRIEGVISYNAFSPNGVRKVTPETLTRVQEDRTDTPSAIYTLPSLFNHSCHPNAVWRCFGDIMVIRARETIPCGREITLPYVLGDTCIAREKDLTVILQGPCDCVLCDSDRGDGEKVCQFREALIQKRRAAKLETLRKTGSSLDRKAAEAHAQRMESTYGCSQTLPRPPLFDAYADIMQSIEHEANRRHQVDLLTLSIQQGFKALTAAGFAGIDTALTGKCPRHTLPLSKECLSICSVDIDVSIVLMAHLSASFLQKSEVILAERWFRAAWWVHDASFGGGKALFEERLGDILSKVPVPPTIQYGWD